LPLRDRSTYRPKGRKADRKRPNWRKGGISEKGDE
jgi:hypothetical protein